MLGLAYYNARFIPDIIIVQDGTFYVLSTLDWPQTILKEAFSKEALFKNTSVLQLTHTRVT